MGQRPARTLRVDPSAERGWPAEHRPPREKTPGLCRFPPPPGVHGWLREARPLHTVVHALGKTSRNDSCSSTRRFRSRPLAIMLRQPSNPVRDAAPAAPTPSGLRSISWQLRQTARPSRPRRAFTLAGTMDGRVDREPQSVPDARSGTSPRVPTNLGSHIRSLRRGAQA